MQDLGRASTTPLRLNAAGGTDIGRSREHNEDTVLLRPDLSLFLLADGAGGHNAGNIASALATTSVAHHFESTQQESRLKPVIDDLGIAAGARRISRAIQVANKDIVEIAKTRNNFQGMGTTLVAASFQLESGLLHLAHVGDSRCYRVREGRIEQLTDDHSLANDILELRPDLDDAVMAKLPRNVVTRALGMETALRVAVRTHRIVPGDKYVLCSDGLTGVLEDDEILDVIRISKTADEAVALLIDMANEAGTNDNVAAVVVHVELSPGVSSFPRRSTADAVVPRIKRPRPPPTALEASSPEIVIVGVEMLEDDSSAQFRVVPAESSSPNLLSALGTFVSPLRPARPLGKPSANPPAMPPPIPKSPSTAAMKATSGSSAARPSASSAAIPAAVRPSSSKMRAASTCEKCGKAIEGGSLVCAFCGTPRDLGSKR